MTDRAAFIAAILAVPDDDAPRLVFADWLEERGECDRAEFIRIQCELAQRYKCELNEQRERELKGQRQDGFWSPHWLTATVSCECSECHLRRRERELLGRGRDVWFDCPLSGFWTSGLGEGVTVQHWKTNPYDDGEEQHDSRPVLKATFRRGFVRSITCSWPTWRDNADAILREHPVREVTLTTMPTGVFGGLDISQLDYEIQQQSALYVWLNAHGNWPGIRFTLPPSLEQNVISTIHDRLSRRMAEDIDRLFQEAAGGVPPH